MIHFLYFVFVLAPLVITAPILIAAVLASVVVSISNHFHRNKKESKEDEDGN